MNEGESLRERPSTSPGRLFWHRLLILLVLLLPGSVTGWNTLMHSELALLSHSALPPQVRDPLLPYLSDIMWGAMAPDLTIQDWANHDINIHGKPGSTAAAQARIEALSSSIRNKLGAISPVSSELAYQMGLLSHYIADVNQPLHTDERPDEKAIHADYETDSLTGLHQFPLTDPGVRFRFSPAEETLRSALQANRYYTAVAVPYFEGNGASNPRGISRINVQRAAEDIRDSWLTLWEQSREEGPRLALWTNKRRYYPGESVKSVLSVLRGQQAPDTRVDLFVAVVSESGQMTFLDADSQFGLDQVPWREDLVIENDHLELFDELLWPETASGHYQLYAVMVPHGKDPMVSGNWTSNLASHAVTIEAIPDIRLSGLADEIYLFPAQLDADLVTPLPLRRWDIIFLGDSGEDPSAADGQSMTDIVIPGRFSHILVYMGRDTEGVPYALEHTNSFEREIVNLRLVRLPEFSRAVPGSEAMMLPLLSKELWSYRLRWAKRLVASELSKLLSSEQALLEKLEQDWRSGVDYQLEYSWSGDFTDRAVYLVDDGMANGASCTDYWLANLETVSNVCIHGSRMDAQELTDFYRLDPDAANAQLPESLNPFPFDISAAYLIDELGFYLVDPAPHIFSCDGSKETGVPVPDRLFNSPQLEEITPDPEVGQWP